MMTVWRMNSSLTEAVTAFRHECHEYPELSHEEYETSRRICDFLKTLPGVEILTLPGDRAAEKAGQRPGPGVVARLRGTAPGAAAGVEVGLRADIDALRQHEETGLPWASRVPGVMHACGHDFHTAALLGAAALLSAHREELTGTVDFLFQTAEETTDGMQAMIDRGLFEVISPDYVFGLHNRPEVPTGQIVCNEGPLMAAKINVTVRMIGFGGHGSMPHRNIDPVVAAASAILSLQTIVSRNTDPQKSVVLTVGYLAAGEPANMVVDDVTLGICIRAQDDEMLAMAESRMTAILEGTAAAYGCRVEITCDQRLPAVFNSPTMTKAARRAAAAVVGAEQVITVPPVMASEDFAVMMARVPSFFYWVGSGRAGEENPPWHHPAFRADDRALPTAAELLAASVREMLTDR